MSDVKKSNTAAPAAPKEKKKREKKVITHDFAMMKAMILMYVDGRLTNENPMSERDLLKAALGRNTPEGAKCLSELHTAKLIIVLSLKGRKERLIMPIAGHDCNANPLLTLSVSGTAATA